MLQTTIVPKYINPPKGNARSWSVKDVNGEFWGFPEHLRPRFVEGQPVHVSYDDRVVNNRTFHNIKDVAPAGAAPPPQQPAPQPQQAPQAPRQFVPPPAAPVHTPSPQYGTSKDEQIFVCGLINNWVGARGGNFPTVAELSAAVNTARQAFADTLGGQQ